MGNIGIPQLLIVVVIVLVLFGTKKLRNIGSDLGAAVKGFKNAMDDDPKKADEVADNTFKKEALDHDNEAVNSRTSQEKTANQEKTE